GARGPTVDERARVLRESVGHLSWAAVAVTDVQLIADIADGFDLVVMGADKWAQVNDPTFYDESVAARDHALARLPELAIAPRPPVAVPAAMQLDVPAWAAGVSSSRARAGEGSLMTPEARRSGLWAED
ncbi:MAG: hypothetical protein OEU32_08500, partial [Acidimicrobiia bacterium]|nr:hypothetical protein [Acidimicrobiia bacterium]